MKWLITAILTLAAMSANAQMVEPSIDLGGQNSMTVHAERAGTNQFRFVVQIPPNESVTMWKVVDGNGGRTYATRVVTETAIVSPVRTSVVTTIPEDVDDVRVMILRRTAQPEVKFVNLIGR